MGVAAYTCICIALAFPSTYFIFEKERDTKALGGVQTCKYLAGLGWAWVGGDLEPDLVDIEW